jgi:hypothetical protein
MARDPFAVTPTYDRRPGLLSLGPGREDQRTVRLRAHSFYGDFVTRMLSRQYPVGEVSFRKPGLIFWASKRSRPIECERHHVLTNKANSPSRAPHANQGLT